MIFKLLSSDELNSWSLLSIPSYENNFSCITMKVYNFVNVDNRTVVNRIFYFCICICIETREWLCVSKKEQKQSKESKESYDMRVKRERTVIDMGSRSLKLLRKRI